MLCETQEKESIDSNKLDNEDVKAKANIPTLSPCSSLTPASSSSETVQSNRFWAESDLSNNEDSNEDDENKDNEIKMDEILSCLNGVAVMKESDNGCDEEDKVVSLWHLRQLAITRHGLISASIRKRVWPKLVGANEQILTASFASLPSHFSRSDVRDSVKANKVNDVTNSDVEMIKNDIQDCIWSIEKEIKAVRRQRDHERGEKRSLGLNIRTGFDGDSSVASLDSGCSSITTGKITPQLIPECIRAFPRLSTAVASPHVSGTSTPVSGIATPNTVPSITPYGIQNMSINENSVVPTVITNVRKSRRKQKEEQALLLSIITSILRTVPEEENFDDCDFDADDDTVVADNTNKLYYFKGMHNIIAPLLITLESPSLTSLIFNRLAQSHLRDAMGSTFDGIQASIRLVFLTLLKKVDKALYDYLVRGGLEDPCVFALPWVLCWFSSDIPNYEIISRLFDVFIATHASFPIYLSVAMITYPSSKDLIMMTPCKHSALVTVMRSLPACSASHSDAINIFEDIIELAISYMCSNPLEQMLKLCKAENNELVHKSVKVYGGVQMLKGPPSWAYTSFASTDWTLIKRAKFMRGLSPTSRLQRISAMNKNYVNEHNIDGDFVHDLALDLSGMNETLKESIKCQKKKMPISRRYLAVTILLLAVVSVLTYDAILHHRGNTFDMQQERVMVVEKFTKAADRKGLESDRINNDYLLVPRHSNDAIFASKFKSIREYLMRDSDLFFILE